jgi:hypothetical protein
VQTDHEIKKKSPRINSGTFLSGINCIRPWCSIKDDYRILVGLEDVTVVEKNYTTINEEEE